MQVLPEYANNSSSSLPTVQNTSPVQQSSVPERVDASPPPTVDNGRQASTEENLVDARDARRESVVSVGITIGPSSQPVEFTAGQPPQLYRSSSVGYFANRLHAGASFQHVRRSPDSYRYVTQC